MKREIDVHKTCTDAMLQAAVNTAVENGLLPEVDSCESVAGNWRRMEECINAAMGEAKIPIDTDSGRG